MKMRRTNKSSGFKTLNSTKTVFQSVSKIKTNKNINKKSICGLKNFITRNVHYKLFRQKRKQSNGNQHTLQELLASEVVNR